MMESHEASLASRGDQYTTKGKFYLSLGGTSGITSTAIFASSLGGAAALRSTTFSRWRLNKLVFKINPVDSPAYVGVLDDNGGEGGSSEQPTTQFGVTQLRCSTAQFGVTPQEFKWDPIDPNAWKYVVVGTDARLSVPCTIYAYSTDASPLFIEVGYSVSFEGTVSSS